MGSRAGKGDAPDRIEQVDEEVRARIAAAFEQADGPGVVHIDATGSIDEVEAAAWLVVLAKLSGINRVSTG